MLGTMLPSHGPAQGDEECQLNLDYSFRPQGSFRIWYSPWCAGVQHLDRFLDVMLWTPRNERV